MLGIAPTSPFRLQAALTQVLDHPAGAEGHVYLPLGELVDRTARQLDEHRATSGRWTPDQTLVAAVREYGVGRGAARAGSIRRPGGRRYRNLR
jgi:hypothetical protein